MNANLKQSKNPEQKIRVALSAESAGDFKGWVAECLDFDLVAQGKTVEEAKQSFQRTLIGHIGLAIKNRKSPFWHSCEEANAKPKPARANVSLPTYLRNLNISFSQLERTKTVSVI